MNTITLVQQYLHYTASIVELYQKFLNETHPELHTQKISYSEFSNEIFWLKWQNFISKLIFNTGSFYHEFLHTVKYLK